MDTLNVFEIFFFSITRFFLSYLIAFALVPKSLADDSSGLPNQNPQIKTVKYQYKPIHPEVWKEIELGISDKNFPYVLILADQKWKEFAKKGELDRAEIELALARTLIHSGMGYSATLILSNILKTKQGSSVAIQALFELEEIVKQYPTDPIEVVNELIVDIEYGNIPQEISDFVLFHRGLYYTQIGNKKWAKDAFEKVKPSSYWGKKITYNEAIAKVAQEKLEDAQLDFKSIMEDSSFPEDLRKKAKHNLGRILFEKEKFDESFQLLSSLDLDPRDRGTILLERAWAKYYLRDYAKALGLLTAYEAPIFDPSRTGEAYILKMLIFKELCYYKSAFEVKDQFLSRFNDAFLAIKKRKNLKENKEIVNLSVLDLNYRNLVDYLNQIKDEYSKILKTPYSNLSYIKKIRSKFKTKISELYHRINIQIEHQVRKVGNDLLDWEEQISFLDFQTKIDSLKINRNSDLSDVTKEEIPHMSFDKIYWIFSNNEFWMDEIEKLIVNVESKCKMDSKSKK